MSEGFFQRIANYFARNSAVSRVAGDPAIAAELLLLIKLIFADGERDQSETQAFARIAEQQFGIPNDALPEVIRYLSDYGYETSTGQAATLFAELAPERRVSLIENLMTVAAADQKVDKSEVALIERIAAILGVAPEDVQHIRATA